MKKETPIVVGPDGQAVKEVLQNKQSFIEYIFETINAHKCGAISDAEAVTRALLITRVQKQADIEMKYAYLTKRTPNIPLLEEVGDK